MTKAHLSGDAIDDVYVGQLELTGLGKRWMGQSIIFP
jgi:hypothetical protein